MDIGEIKDEYRARVEPRGKSISEILEEAAKETKAYKQLEKENIKLNEFKEKRKESRFYFKAQMERAEPKTAREAEDLQRAKEIFEKLYREELSCLEEENKKLKEKIEKMKYGNSLAFDDIERICNEKLQLEEENKKLEEEVKKWKMVADENEKLREEIKSRQEEVERFKTNAMQDMAEITELEEENKRLQSSLDYVNRDREDMHNKIIELGNKRESQRNMNYKIRKENKELKEKLNKAGLEEYGFFNEY